MIPVKTSLLFIIQHMDVGLRPVGCVHWGQGSQWKALPVSVCVWKVFLSAWKSVLNHEPVLMATERATPNSTQVVSCHQLWTNVITSFPGFFFSTNFHLLTKENSLISVIKYSILNQIKEWVSIISLGKKSVVQDKFSLGKLRQVRI